MDAVSPVVSDKEATVTDPPEASIEETLDSQEPSIVEQNVFVAFQGGGARGVVHAGALGALEDGLAEIAQSDEGRVKLRLVGVAGTSAGSIVAALVASGKTSDDLYNPATGRHLLSGMRNGAYRSLTGLFTARGWKNILRAKSLSAYLAFIAGLKDWMKLLLLFFALLILSAYLLFLGVEPSRFLPAGLAASARTFVNAATVIIPVGLILGIIVGSFVAWRLRPGLAPLSEVRYAINEVIRDALPKLKDYDAGKSLVGDYVSFKCLKQCGGLPLRIVATDLTNKDVRLFSAETTPDVAIADAVCASIGLPYIFKPHNVKIHGRPHDFADGGFLSNLPLWAFDEDRAKDRDCWSIGMSIKSIPKVSDKKDNKPSHWASAILDAVVSGPSAIHRRGIDNLMIVELPSSLGLVDFGESEARFRGEIRRARLRASEMLQAQFKQWKLTRFIQQLDQLALAALNEKLRDVGISERASLTSRVYVNSHKWSLLIAGPGSGLGGVSSTRFPRIDIPVDTDWCKVSDTALPAVGLWSVLVRLQLPPGADDFFVTFHSSDLTIEDLSAITELDDISLALGLVAHTLRDFFEELDLALVTSRCITRDVIVHCGSGGPV
ncbi:hypothetical protein AE929_14465 [Xanthomonas arboricola]|uniref:Patatin-like phospholipase family protein n=2 Tax=Xanthomonas TaxID=338 RepID=A0A7U7DAX1_XANCJ|nr:MULTISPECIES: patatin-like phospholipase family protein [Xanthomonas]KOB01494.1 hypothetical protein AE920_05715 [Xanthomonas arboricola]KOB17490.1 hypothetical protein AE924_04140 [Xanthomonas arboricola]KOB34764.1 hypothetical protein AE929_14465 [Xanthomonas arboricola]MDA4139197.1 patatin-like phospholipase family protein [Xanthomonas hortorum pv. vitians]QNM62092.1 hypothetical protein XHV734_3354 [Xanthomonas hortorum pv. vitians]